MTAMIRMLMVAFRSIEDGATIPLNQAEKMPASEAKKPASVKASIRCSGTLNPSALMRTGSSRTPWRAKPNGVLTM